MAYPGGLNLLVTWHGAMPNFEQSDLIRGAGSPRQAHTMTAGVGMWVPCGGEGLTKVGQALVAGNHLEVVIKYPGKP